jgi:anti-sigma factor RsiW
VSTPEHMPCNEFVELVTEYLEGAMDPETRRRFEHHVGLCPGCATYVEQMRQTAQLVGRLEEEDLSEPARTRLLEAFRDWKAT